MSTDVRAAFLAAASVAVELIGRRAVGERWHDPSALDGYEVGTLAGHLARALLTVHWYLDMPEPDPPVISAPEYFAALGRGGSSPEDEAQVRARAADAAKGGWARLYLDVGKALDHLAARLPGESPEHRIPALGQALVLDEYLKTRIVELVVHVDDVARSLEIPPPALPLEATHLAIEVLVDAARVRHGDRAVVHALTRRELDGVQALRVL